MGADCVLDACVAAKVFFEEPGSAEARKAVSEAGRLIAPEWISLEIASIAVKKIRSGAITAAQGRQVVADLPMLLDALAPVGPLAGPTLEMALATMTSTYDAAYAALAQRENLPVLTADRRFATALGAHKGAPRVILIEAG